MKKLLSILLLISFGIFYCQINVEKIKKNVTENPQKFYYDYVEIFKKDPSKLTPDEMNQLYYGSRFVKSEYSNSDYSNDYNKIWKIAKDGMNSKKAKKIIEKAEICYQKNPLDKGILTKISWIYIALNEKSKSDLCIFQKQLIQNTIVNSGTGKTEDSPICVIREGDMIVMIEKFLGGFGDFKQKDKSLPDGSFLTEYSIGDNKIFVKLVGGFQF